MEPTIQVLMQREEATNSSSMCVWGRERQTENGKVSQKATFMKNRVHTLWLCSPRITAVWIGSLLSLLIAYCFLWGWWRWVVCIKRGASQEYQRKYKSMFSLLSICQTCKCLWDHLGCDFPCGVIRNLCKLLYSVSQYQRPQRRSWSETLLRLCESFEPVTFYLLHEISNHHSYAVLLH